MIESISYSQFFSNEYDAGLIPEITLANENDPEIIALVDREINRCMGGVFVDGIFFSGWLYWHLNHWWIRDDAEDEYENIVRKVYRPSLRDNEWIVANYLELCRIQRKAYLHVGVRQFGKSEIMASYLAYHAILFANTQNVVMGGNDNDLGLIKDKIDFGIKNLWRGIKIPKLDKDLKKNMIRLGVKTKSNEDEIWSYIIIRNVSEGKKLEGPAGVTSKSFAIDEIGKFAFAAPYESAKPSFVSKFGWRCVPIMFGTGGFFEKGNDAERFFNNPESNNILSVTDPETGKRTAVFMSGLYRIDCKYSTTLGEYLLKQSEVEYINEDSDLFKIKMSVSDKDKARQLILEERRQKANDPDQSTYLQLIMFYPLTPEECFLSSARNFYNTDIARMRRERVESLAYKPMYVELYEEDGIIKHKDSTKLPILSYPTTEKTNLDTPICILEHPVPNPPYALYVGGIDPYRFASAKYSDSLGAVYIFKRVYDVLTDTFQDMIVAWYVGRPADKAVWNNNARLLLKYFNAQGLCENDEMSFIDYMETKGEGYYLMDTPDWLRDFIPTSSTLARPKGISRENEKVRELLRTNFKQYMEGGFMTVMGVNDKGEREQKKLLGVEKINDIPLLMEIEKWNEDGNFDREIAASLAITAAKYFDKQNISANAPKDDPRFKAKRNKRGVIEGRKQQVFKQSTKSVIRKGSHKLFK